MFSISVLYLGAYLGFAALLTIGPESFPTKVRSIGNGFVNICGRLGGIAAPIVTGSLLDINGGKFVMICILGSLYLMACFVVLTLDETRISKKKLLDEKEQE